MEERDYVEDIDKKIEEEIQDENTEDIEEEYIEDIDKVEKEKPTARIKKTVIVILLSFFLIVAIYAFAKAFIEQNRTVQEKNQEEVEEITTNKKPVGVVELNDSYNGLSITELVKKEEKKEINNKGTKNDEILNAINNTSLEDNYFSEEMKQYYTRLVQEEMQARSSSLGFISEEKKESNSNYNSNNSGSGMAFNVARNGIDDPANTAGKKEFLNSEQPNKNYNSSVEEMPYSPYEIKQGTIIPGVMWTGMDSTLPGDIIGLVREDVYDTVTGNILLIPKGTKIAGKYDSAVTFGQDRILFIWQRLIFPNGKSLNLDNFSGADLSGYAGITGKVDNHLVELLQGVVLSSILGAGAAVVTDDDDDWRNAAASGAGEQIISIGDTWMNKLINVPPRIKVTPGERFTIIVRSDLRLSPWK